MSIFVKQIAINKYREIIEKHKLDNANYSTQICILKDTIKMCELFGIQIPKIPELTYTSFKQDVAYFTRGISEFVFACYDRILIRYLRESSPTDTYALSA